MKDSDKSHDRAATLEYLDFLASVLTEHEKNLDRLIERLRNIVETMEKESEFQTSKEIFEVEKDLQQENSIEKKPKIIAYIKLIEY